ncbi:MAG: VOC family protein [Actinomycetota bacterium]
MKVDHICFAVKNLAEGISYWESVFGYRQMTGVVRNTLQKVKVVFLTKEDSVLVKLIEPAEDNKSLINFVSKGGGFHHLCFRVEEMGNQIIELKGKGLLTLVPPQPGEAFNNHDIAFLKARYGLNIELIDTDEKAALL